MMFAIVRTAINVDAVAQSVRREAWGAVVSFAGIVRVRADDNRLVTGLSYEAHDAMALAEFERIACEARDRFGPCEIAIVHRVGELNIGEVAVAVAAASAHRANAFDACEYVIDEVKARAPIWKKEHYVDGSGEWIANDCRTAARSR
jgi:molybdopterin synthase catalytic subunit